MGNPNRPINPKKLIWNDSPLGRKELKEGPWEKISEMMKSVPVSIGNIPIGAIFSVKSVKTAFTLVFLLI